MENDKRDVIDWLNDVANDEQWTCYYSDSEIRLLAKDALEMLKAQEPVKPVIKQEMDDICSFIDNVAYCGKCGERIGRLKHDYCWNCGRKVAWND